MGRVESTVRVPVEQAQLINAGSFRFDTSDAEAAQQIGGVLQELGKRKIAMQDRIAVSNANATMEQAQIDYQQDIIGKPLDQHAAILQKHVNKAKGSIGQQKMSSDTRDLVQNRSGIWGNSFAEQGELANIQAVRNEAGVAVLGDYTDAIVSGDPTRMEETRDAFFEHFADTPEKAQEIEAKILKSGRQQFIKDTSDNIKVGLRTAYETSGKKSALKSLRMHLDELQSGGVLTKSEATQADQSLGNWLDSFVFGREKASASTKSEKIAEAYGGLSDALLSGDLALDEITDSGIPVGDIGDMQAYMLGSREPEPDKTRTDGHDKVHKIVLERAADTTGTADSMKSLMQLRYVDKKITDEEFTWGRDRILEPYPRELASTIASGLKTQGADFGGVSAQEKQIMEQNRTFTNTVDTLLKDESFMKKTRAEQSRIIKGEMASIKADATPIDPNAVPPQTIPDQLQARPEMIVIAPDGTLATIYTDELTAAIEEGARVPQ